MFEALVVLAVFILVEIPALFYRQSFSAPIHVLCLAPLALTVIKRLLAEPATTKAGRDALLASFRRLRTRPALSVTLLAYVALLTVSLVRAALARRVSLAEAASDVALCAAVASLGFAVFAVSQRAADDARRVRFLGYGIMLCLLLNVVLHLSGVTNPSGQEDRTLGATATMLDFLGVPAQRLLFPLASGLNTLGILAGAGFVFGAVVVARSTHSIQRLLGFCSLAAGTYVMLQSDTRVALASAILVSGLVVLVPSRILAQARWSTVLAPFFPLMIVLVAAYLLDFAPAAVLARSPRDLGTASNRAIAWLGVIQELRRFSPAHLWGYGYLGAAAAGVLADFYVVFDVTFDIQRITAHNAIMQHILDIGYVGAATFLLLFWYALGGTVAALRNGYRYDTTARIVAGLLVYLLITGATEASPTLYTPETFVLFMLTCATALGPWTTPGQRRGPHEVVAEHASGRVLKRQ